MALEYRQRKCGGVDVILSACPLCGHAFAPQEKRSEHFANEHGPEDIGL